VNVEAVQQRAGDALLVSAHHGVGAGALVDMVTVQELGSPFPHKV
jgi:hypothetical protein